MLSCFISHLPLRNSTPVPRITSHNLENLRSNFFDVLARIKVPKSKAFHDLRASCPESHLSARNARVLCPNDQIEKDTEFYQKVQAFRNERITKIQTSEAGVKLYIPGRIIHLADTKGDGAKYVPYWASRYEFNQVIMSGRMLADHRMPSIVNILRTLDLDDIHEVNTWHIDEKIDETEDEEVRLIVPCSNPQGKLPLVLVAVTLAAIIMAILANQGCKYVVRSTVIDPPDGEPYPGIGLNAGLWSYNLKQCSGEGGCNTTEPYGAHENYTDSEYCQVYSDFFVPDIYWKSARAFSTFSQVLGFAGLILLSTATCTKLKTRTWVFTCSVFLLATLFQGLQFLFFKSDLCTEWEHPTDEGYTAVSDCSLATDGKLGVACTVLWFVVAVGCAQMARIAYWPKSEHTSQT